MKLFYRLAIAMIALPLLCSAQSNYKPGYIIDLKGDTTKGLVNYQEWSFNPVKFQFKTSTASEVKTITTAQVTHLGINGLEYYDVYSGPISTDETSINGQSARDTSFKVESVFLKVLDKGKNITLYSYADNLKERFFIKEQNAQSATKELVYRIYYRNGRTTTENTFVQQLFEEASKYNVTSEHAINLIEKAEYKSQDLVKISEEINKQADTRNEKRTLNKPIQFFAGLGVNVATFKLTTVQTDLQPTTTSAFPLISAGFDVLTNPNTGKLILRVEFKATENKYKVSYTQLIYPYTPVNHSFTQLQVMVIPQIVYNLYNTDNFKFYISPGMQVSLLSYSNQKYYQINGNTTEPTNPLYSFHNFLVTTSLKTGVKINKRVDLSASYQLPNNISYGAFTTIKLHSIYGSVNYYF